MDADKHRAAMVRRGRTDGQAAASWFFDGNTEPETYVRVQKGINDGDPEIMDTLPHADLSGQFADSKTGEDIVREEIGDEIEEYQHCEDDGDGESGPHLVCWYEIDDLITAYEDAFSSAAESAIMHSCQLQLS